MKNSKKIIIFFFFLFFVLLFRANCVLALEVNYPTLPFTDIEPPQVFIDKIERGEPGYEPEKALPLYAKYLYTLFLTISGVAAFFATVYGGLLYLFSVGHPTRMKLAKNQIMAGILGLLVLFWSYLIIVIINPQLTIFGISRQRITPPEFHRECIGGQCIPVPGSGSDLCADSSECPKEGKKIYIEIPFGWLIERVKLKSEIAKEQANDVWFVAAEDTAIGHTSLEELAKCLDLLRQECKCDMTTHEDCCPMDAWTSDKTCEVNDQDCSPSSVPPCYECCREPCNRCINKAVCAGVDPLSDPISNPDPLDDICSGVSDSGFSSSGAPAVSCPSYPAECNLRLVLDAKQAEFDILISQLWEERADAEKALRALQIEKQKLEIAEALMRDSYYPPISYPEFAGIEEAIPETLQGFEHAVVVELSSTLEENPDLAPPLSSCRDQELTEQWWEITPSCAPCPCYPEEGCSSILFCYGNAHRGPDDLCETDSRIPDREMVGYVFTTIPGGTTFLYNGGAFLAPDGGVAVCHSLPHHCNDPRCKQTSGAPGIGIPVRISDDPANFYISREGNEDIINIVINILAMIQNEGLGPGANPGDFWAGDRCPSASLPHYIDQWNATRTRAEDHMDEIMAAAAATGIRPALIMALISQESGFEQFPGTSGGTPCSGLWGCYPCDMCYGDNINGSCLDHSICSGDWWIENNCRNFQRLWETLTGSFAYGTLNCPLGQCRAVQMPVSAAFESMCGGAMGLAQAMVFNWETLMGFDKNPWEISNAYLFAARKLKRDGEADVQTCVAEVNAVHQYIGATPKTLEYAQCVVQLANHISLDYHWQSCTGGGFNPPPAPGPPGSLPPLGPADVLPIELYCQNDPLWTDELLGNDGQAMGRWGCNLTSFAMILRYLNFGYTPLDIADFVNENNLWTVGQGLNIGNHGLFEMFRRKEPVSYGMKDVSADEVANELNNGHPVFTGCTNFDKSATHWIVIRGIVGDDIYISDPYCGWVSQDGGPYEKLSREEFENFNCGQYYTSFWNE